MREVAFFHHEADSLLGVSINMDLLLAEKLLTQTLEKPVELISDVLEEMPPSQLTLDDYGHMSGRKKPSEKTQRGPPGKGHPWAPLTRNTVAFPARGLNALAAVRARPQALAQAADQHVQAAVIGIGRVPEQGFIQRFRRTTRLFQPAAFPAGAAPAP